jgi:hypothetical protein
MVTAVGTSLTPDQLRAARWAALLLGRPPWPANAGAPGATVAAAAAHLGGLQAQAAPPARLAVRPRTAGLTAADVDRACADRDATRDALAAEAADVGRFLGTNVTFEVAAPGPLTPGARLPEPPPDMEDWGRR